MALLESTAQVKDPTGFEAQERRRTLYAEMKKTCKIAKVAVAMPELACKGFLDGPNEIVYDDYNDIAPTFPWPSAPPLTTAVSAVAKIRFIFTGTTQSELLHSAKAALMKGVSTTCSCSSARRIALS